MSPWVESESVTQASEPSLPSAPHGERHHGLPLADTVTFSAPLEALARDEIRRTRRYCYVSFTISLMCIVAMPWLGGDPTVATLLRAAIAIALLGAAFLLYQTRDAVQFHRPITMIGKLMMSIGNVAALPYFGVFSAHSVLFVLAIYFSGVGKSRRLAYGVYIVSASVHAGVSLLVITGAIRDTGIVRAANLEPHQQLIVQGLVQLVFAATLFTARTSRRTQLVAIEELEREVRLSAHREALLIEAREQLDRVLRPGRGRFSDQQIGGYRLGPVIGRGAMGEVYEATGPGGRVAVKLLSQASLGNTNHVLRFLRELRTAALIRAPNVVTVLEVGEEPVPYLVMERLEGKTLSEILHSTHELGGAEVVELIRQIGLGITAAGAAGVVHRDLKPRNVFRHGDTWKVLDFGIARALDQGDTLTAGQIVGTPSYMAPEQATGGVVDHATDLYALAAIAYRALTGHPPFGAGEVADTLYRVVHTAPRRPSDLATQLPREVDLVLAIGLAKQPADRFATAAAFVEALEAALAGHLAPPVQHRGLALVQAGAWSEPRRAGTFRGPRGSHAPNLGA